uniref:J domain-containing protein n=1 Tax=Acrobeloides nanus TaxID=290746 RepID=A0A914BYF2_9BILA
MERLCPQCFVGASIRSLLPCRLYSSVRKTHYDVLGVSKNATLNDIKAAFYTLSKKYHPDVVGSNSESAKKFLEVKEAYDVLKDQTLRQNYDLNIGSGQPYQSSNFGSSYQYPPGYGYQNQQRPRYKYNRDFEWWNKPNDEWSKEFQRVWERMNQNRQRHKHEEDLYKEWQKRTWEDHNRRRSTKWANSEKEKDSENTGYHWKYEWKNSQHQKDEKLTQDLIKIFHGSILFFMVLSLLSMMSSMMRTMDARKRDSSLPISKKEMDKMRKMMETPPPPRPTSNIWDE